MTDPFVRVDVTSWTVLRRETTGQSATIWLRDPELPSTPEHEWLFKPLEAHGDGRLKGTDWAEKASSEIGNLIGVPSAEIQLATRGQEVGSISRNVRPDRYDMWSGSLWLDSLPEVSFSAAASTKSQRNHGATPGYTFDGVIKALAGVGPPPGYDELKLFDATDVFAGFLLLDGLVANRDRHEENWSVLLRTAGPRQPLLAPSYDLAGTLGYQLTDDYREDLLGAKKGFSLRDWAIRGDAWRFDPGSDARHSLVDLACHALYTASEAARLHWIDRMESFSSTDLESVFARLPMSDVSRKFATDLVITNAERILDGHRNYAP